MKEHSRKTTYEERIEIVKYCLAHNKNYKETAEIFFERIEGEKRLASERDATETVYNLFGQPTWKNLYLLDMDNMRIS